MPWCYIGKHRIEDALKLVPDVPVEVHWRPFFLNNWVPREGISRDEYLTAKFGSVEAYKGIAGRVVAAANEEGLTYHPELVKRQPNTIDCHRLIHWAEAKGKAAEMKQRLMELYFRDGGDLTDTSVAGAGGRRCRPRRRRRAQASCHRRGCRPGLGQAQEAAEKGISGVPTFVFAQKYAVSGAQPAEQLARAIRQVSAEINAQAAEVVRNPHRKRGSCRRCYRSPPSIGNNQETTMIYELRTYTVRPGTVWRDGEGARARSRATSAPTISASWKATGSPRSVRSIRSMHMWSYADLNERTEAARRDSGRIRAGPASTFRRSVRCCCARRSG